VFVNDADENTISARARENKMTYGIVCIDTERKASDKKPE